MRYTAFFVAVLVLGAVACDRASSQVTEVEFEEAKIFFEYNSTDLDLGVHIFFDAEGWENVEVSGPDGTLFKVENSGNLREIGSTELFTEGEEPPLDEQNLEEEIAAFLALFPEGEYQFSGTTIEGDDLVGTAELTHDLPAAVELDLSAYPTISWIDTSGVGDPEIVSYQVINELVVEEDGEERVFEFSIDLLADATEVTVPAEFEDLFDVFGPDVVSEYKVEVIAIEESGNKTITEESLIEEEE